MKYIMTQNQARYIQEHYHFQQLLGLNQKVRVRSKVRSELLEKGVIYDNQGYDELHPAFRALFSRWENMRYSVARADLNRDTRFQCLLTNRISTIFFDREDEEIRIDLLDFSEQMMDQFFAVMAELTPCAQVERPFTIGMQMEDYRLFINAKEEEDYIHWQKRLGIPAALLKTYQQAILREEDGRLLLVEDHLEEVGYMMKISPTEEGFYALKHVTYENGDERVVLIFGNDTYLINSIYQF